MPKTKSAKKALRQSKKRRMVNIARKKSVKSVLKNYKNLILEGGRDEAKTVLPMVYKKLDKLAKVNVIKKGKADRLKSRLAKKLAVKLPALTRGGLMRDKKS